MPVAAITDGRLLTEEVVGRPDDRMRFTRANELVATGTTVALRGGTKRANHPFAIVRRLPSRNAGARAGHVKRNVALPLTASPMRPFAHPPSVGVPDVGQGTARAAPSCAGRQDSGAGVDFWGLRESGWWCDAAR